MFLKCLLNFFFTFLLCRGGLELRITGTYLDTIQRPKIFIIYPSSNGSLETDVRVRTDVGHL